MEIKFPRTTPPYQVYWCWDITYECNYNCSYCITDRNRKTRYLEVKKWEEIWNNIFENYGSTHIRFSGGEPFIYPDFINLLKVLGKHHTLNVTTNLSFDVKYFVDEIKEIAEKSRLVISASFHPEYIDLKKFIDKVCFLKANGIYTSASIVAWPLFLKELHKIKEEMEKYEIQFLVIPLQGNFWGKRFPEGYTEEEKKFLEEFSITVSNPSSKDMVDFKIKEKNKKDSLRLCRMGQNFGMIRPNGDVYRCCTFDNSAYLGNIIDGTFKLLEEPKLCDITPCSCYKAMLVEEDEKIMEKWNWHKHKGGIYYFPVLDRIIDTEKESTGGIIKNVVEKIKEYEKKYEKTIEPERMIQEMLIIHKIYPEHPCPLHFLIELYIRMKKFDEAEFLLKKALNIPEDKANTYRFWANLYTEKKEFDKAQECFNKALLSSAEDKNRGYIYFDLGRFYMKIGDIDKALESFKKAHELLPEDKVIENAYKDLRD